MSDPTRHRQASGIAAVLASLDERLEAESEILDAFLLAQSRGQLTQEAWTKLFAAAVRHDRLSDLAFAFEAVTQDKRIKTLSAGVVAEFMFRAAVFFGDTFGDEDGSHAYLDRALAAQPSHTGARERLESTLVKKGDFAGLGEYYIEATAHRPRAEQIELFRKAAGAFQQARDGQERLVEVLTALVRIAPDDAEARTNLVNALDQTGKTKELSKLLEQALTQSGEDLPSRVRLISLYSSDPKEIERAMPHVEVVLAADPKSEPARAAAHRMLDVKATSARAAEMLATVAEAESDFARAAQLWTLALEQARGPKRLTALKHLTRIRQDRLEDLVGAFEAAEGALALDAADAELLERFSGLARSLGKQADAARTLQRVSSAVREPTGRARVTIELGEMLLAAGDAKRARAAFSSAISTPGADDSVTVLAARSLVRVFEEDGDHASLADMLERMVKSDPEPSRRLEASQKLAELATGPLGDPAKAIVAWRGLLEGPTRARALTELEPLLLQMGDALGLAEVLKLRAADVVDIDDKRELYVRAAETLTGTSGNLAEASAAWAEIVEVFGPTPDVLARWTPLLEALGDWDALARALALSAEVAPQEEKATSFARLGTVLRQRSRDFVGAVDAFRRALDLDPSDPPSRTALEQILAQEDVDAVLAAADVLEPLYRMESSRGGLLRVLAQRASRGRTSADRLHAIGEALALAETMPNERVRALDLAVQGVVEATQADLSPETWVVAIDRLTQDQGQERRRAEALSRALGKGSIDSDVKLAIATSAARAAVQAGDAQSATQIYRRALSFAPESSELRAELDGLLHEQGTPEDRLQLYRESLARESEPRARAALHRSIARLLEHDLSDPGGAATELAAVLELEPEDAASEDALVDLLLARGAVAEALGWLVRRVARTTLESERRALLVRIADLATIHDDAAIAQTHARALLEDAQASVDDLDAVEHVAERIKDVELTRDVAKARAMRSESLLDRIFWLTRLGEIDAELRSDAGGAAEAWKSAARVALQSGDVPAARKLFERVRKVAPLDREAATVLAQMLESACEWTPLAELLAVLVDCVPPAERVTALLRLAAVLGAHSDDPVGAFDAAARAFDEAPADPDVLSAALTYADLAQANDRLERALAEAINRVVDPNDKAHLTSARARLLVRTSPKEATWAVMAILKNEDIAVASRVEIARGLHADLVTHAPLSVERKKLFDWQRQNDPEKAHVQTENARFLEASGDSDGALVCFREALDDGADVGADVARLTLASGDVLGAAKTMRELADAAQGPARRKLRLELASLFAGQEGHESEALGELRELLAETPEDATVLGVVAKLSRVEACRVEASAMLEGVLSRTSDVADRTRVLRALLDAAHDASAETRKGWLDQLIEIGRGGTNDTMLDALLRGLAEQPLTHAWWDEAERLARELDRPTEVADAYRHALASPLAEPDLLEVGQRAVAFQEEWFEDSTGTIKILDRLVDAEPDGGWAFDRLKLLYDAQERWDDLFPLYDRVLLRADAARKMELLEDAAQIAKDFAKNADRAIGYMEQLLNLKPTNERLIASLERLYERHGRHRELISLLGARVPALSDADARAMRVRMASLWLDEIGDAAAALIVVEELIANADDAATSTRLLERILAAALPGDEVKKTIPPTSSPVTESIAAAARTSIPPPTVRPSQPPRTSPPKSRGKRVLVRQRAAAFLRERYAEPGKESHLARVLEIELEAVKSAKERIRRHRELAALYSQEENDLSALEHCVSLVMLEPATAANRAQLEELAAKTGRYDRMADVLVAAAEAGAEEELRVQLLLQAGLIWADKVGDATRAIDLLFRLHTYDAPAALVLTGARKLEGLLLQAARDADRLSVLERLAQLESEGAAKRAAFGDVAKLASRLGEIDRAVAAWESCLTFDQEDLEALTGLVDVLQADRRMKPLVDVLEKRAAAWGEPTSARIDRVQIAHIWAQDLASPEQAAAAWARVEEEFGESDEGLSASIALASSLERYADLARLLVRAIARAETADDRATLQAQRGDVVRVRLGDGAQAADEYKAALESHPMHPAALLGLRALLGNVETEASATDILLAANKQAEDWPAILELTPHRLRTAKSNADRVHVLLEVAKIAEDRTQEPSRAFEALREALALSYNDAVIEADAVRLAELTGAWRPLADTLRDLEGPLQEHDDAPSLVRLRLRLGAVLEGQLDDPRAALAVYQRVLAVHPTDVAAGTSAVRVSVRVRSWDAAAKCVLDRAVAIGELDEVLIGPLEHHLQGQAWESISSAMESAVAERTDAPQFVSRDLEARVAGWHRDRRADADAAEAAYVRALAHDTQNVDLLGALAQLQRRARGRPLIDSLLRLSQATGGDLDLLREAAEVAGGVVVDRALAKNIIERSLKIATERWLGSDEPPVSSTQPALVVLHVDWALSELVRIHNEEGDAERIVELLRGAAKLPYPTERTRAMQHEAARVSLERLGDSQTALTLYAELFDGQPGDALAASQLAELYTALSRPKDLLSLRHRQIEQESDPFARSDLRVLAARLQAQMGDSDAAIETLRASLSDTPRHPDSATDLGARLASTDRNAELCDLLTSQASLAEADGDKPAAVVLFAHAAVVADQKLANLDRAEASLARSLHLEVRPDTLDSLAKVREKREDWATVAEYLDKLVSDFPEERSKYLLRLADAFVRAHQDNLAQDRLAAALSDPTTPVEAGDVLVGLYRRTEQWVPLADLLTHQASAADPQRRLALLREASDLYLSRCDQPGHAVPLLEAAGALAPDDRALKLRLAEALRLSGRVDEAKDLLKGMLDAFAGRRPKERAVVHFHMARLALAMGQRQQALAELEAATKVDPSNPEILRTVAELARDDGQLEKAERSYRALLAVVRRENEVTDETPIVRAEVLVELSALASRQEEEERAQEILESAFEAAASSDVEARRLEQTLRLRKMHAPLVRALEARLSRADEGPKAAEVLSELAQILEEEVGDSPRAIQAALRAVREAPALPIVHERALSLARKLGKESAYLDAVTSEAEKAERASAPRLSGDLFMRAGAIAAVSDPRLAAEYLTRAEKTGGTLAREALRALDKLYGELDDHAAQEEALARLASIELEATVRDPRAAADVLYRLASVRLRKAETIDEGAQLLESALGLYPDVARAEEALRAISGEQEQRPAVISLLLRVGREPGREATLLRALGLRVRAGHAPVQVAREAAELALALERLEEADAMLDACETAATDEPVVARWAALARAKLAFDRGDVSAALELTLRAADSAPEDEARELRNSVAERAHASGNTDLWTRALEQALDAHPLDQAAQEALSVAYRATRRADKLASLLARRIDAAQDADVRASLRRERAALLSTELGKPDEASRELEALLDENAHDAEAGALLLSLLETSGDKGGVERVLSRVLEAAKDRQDGALVAKLAQKLGDLLKERDLAAAREAFTLGLDWEPKNPALLRALLASSTEPSDRADVMERLLEVESGPAASSLALDLAAVRAESWDDVGAERAFEMGLRAHPASAVLRDKLVNLYGERGERRKLANLYETVAAAEIPEEALSLLDRAVVIWRDELNDPAGAARALRLTLTIEASDARFAELMSALTLAGDLEGAKVEIASMLESLAIDHPEDRHDVRAALFAQRASLHAQQGDFDAALSDVEQANHVAANAYGSLAMELLERAADNADEPSRAIAYRVRLASALAAVNRTLDARSQLSAVLDADDSNHAGLLLLADLDERANDYAAAADTYRRLAILVDATEIVDVVTKLVLAAEKAGAPALARRGLEKAHALVPGDAEITSKLRAMYEATGAYTELAEMFSADVDAATNDAERFDALVRAGAIYLGKAKDGDRALELLSAANRIKPQDMECVVLVVDALIAVGRIDEAAQTTQSALAAQKGRRSREAGALYHRLARIERHRGSTQGELAMLTAALEMDGQNGVVASELGQAALHADNLELAQKALRVVTMTKSATSMPRAEAYAHLGDIAIRQGDPKRAVMLLKRAVAEDPHQERAHELLRQLGV